MGEDNESQVVAQGKIAEDDAVMDVVVFTSGHTNSSSMNRQLCGSTKGSCCKSMDDAIRNPVHW